MREKWKMCKYADYILVSNKGNLKYNIESDTFKEFPKWLIEKVKNRKVRTCTKNTKKIKSFEVVFFDNKRIRLARLVAELFMENFDATKNVYHKDNNFLNNTIDNLYQK